MDRIGMFYLIHPFEDNIGRNIYNEIIMYNEIPKNLIELMNYYYIFINLLQKNLIVDIGTNTTYYDKSELIDKDRKFIKTELFTLASEYNKKLNINSNVFDPYNLCLTLMASYRMNCFTEVFELVTMLEIIGCDIFMLYNINSFKQKQELINSLKKKNLQSELILLYNIINNFKKHFNFTIFSFNENSKNKMISDNSNIITQFIELRKKSINPPENYDLKLWNKLNHLYYENKLENTTSLFDNYINNKIYQEINDKINEIMQWCRIYNIKPEIFTKFLNRLCSQYVVNPLLCEPNKIFTNFNINYNKLLTTNTIDEKIIRSFLYGLSNQIGIKDVDFKGKFIHLSYINGNYYKINTINSLIIPSDCIFFLEYKKPIAEEDEEDREYYIRNVFIANITSNIDFKWTIPANPIYINPKYYTENNRSIIYLNRKNKSTDIFPIYRTQTYNDIVRTIGNNWEEGLNIFYTNTMPILQNHINKVNKLIISSIK